MCHARCVTINTFSGYHARARARGPQHSFALRLTLLFNSPSEHSHLQKCQKMLSKPEHMPGDWALPSCSETPPILRRTVTGCGATPKSVRLYISTVW